MPNSFTEIHTYYLKPVMNSADYVNLLVKIIDITMHTNGKPPIVIFNFSEFGENNVPEYGARTLMGACGLIEGLNGATNFVAMSEKTKKSLLPFSLDLN